MPQRTRSTAGLSIALLAAILASCGPKRKPAVEPATRTPCLRWSVTVENEYAFPVSVFVYGKSSRTSLGAAPPGISSMPTTDSGQITFSPPLGMSMIVRGRQIRGTFSCTERAAG